MATLELQFNCMCLFVTDGAKRIVHVLMPETHQHAHHEAHVVRMMHRSFTGIEKEKGRDMKGWALVLGKTPESAHTTVGPPVPPPQGDEVVNLTSLTDGRTVRKELVDDVVNPEVAARITLRAGRVIDIDAEAVWVFRNRSVVMAHQVTWQIDDLPEDLTWVRVGATGQPPLASLRDIEHDRLGITEEKIYRLRIFHVPDAALPPPRTGGTLDPDAVKRHFRALYTLLDIAQPGDELLPQILRPPFGKVNCGSAQAALQP